jgi:hypothetical protein
MNFFAAATGRGGGGGRGVGGAPAMATPREPCSFIFYRSRVVVANIPYNTNRAAPIRQYLAARILNENNQRCFIFRAPTGWTTVAANSTPEHPAVTCEPAEVARKVTTILTQCPDVSTVTLLNESNQQITAEDVSNMSFDSLEDHAAAPSASATEDVTVAALHQLMRDNYAKLEEIAQDQKRDMVQLRSDVESKLSYIIDVLDNRARLVDPNRPSIVLEPPAREDEDDMENEDGDSAQDEAAVVDEAPVAIQEVDEAPVAVSTPPAANRRPRGSTSGASSSRLASVVAPAEPVTVGAGRGNGRKRRAAE